MAVRDHKQVVLGVEYRQYQWAIRSRQDKDNPRLPEVLVEILSLANIRHLQQAEMEVLRREG